MKAYTLIFTLVCLLAASAVGSTVYGQKNTVNPFEIAKNSLKMAIDSLNIGKSPSIFGADKRSSNFTQRKWDPKRPETMGYLKIANDKPNPSLNNDTVDLLLLPDTIFIGQFVNFILTGSFNGQTEISDAYDNVTLDELLGFGLLLTNQYFINLGGGNIYDEDELLFLDLVRIKELLRDQGSSAVTVKDLKPYLNVQTAYTLAGLYFALNAETYRNRLRYYILTELLGGVGDENECKTHTAAWFETFPLEFWTIQMFDSMAKLPPGILSGNINWMGDYGQCKDIFNDESPFFQKEPLKGKYCRADIKLPVEQFSGDLPIDDRIGLVYGMCVSSQCNNAQVKSIVSNSLKLMSVFKYASVRGVECEIESPTLPTATIVFTVLLSILIGFVIFATIFDAVLRVYEWSHKTNQNDDETIAKQKADIVGNGVLEPAQIRESKRPKIVKFILDCSMYTNSLRFWRTDNGGKITCLNGIRVFSMIWIIWGHTYNYISDRQKFFLLTNLISIQKFNEELWTQIVINGVFGVDTFFTMSALLLTISFLNKMEKSKGLSPFEWAYYYIHRYWRLMPPFMIIIIIYNYIIPYMFKGPLWNPEDFPPGSDQCKKYWWLFLLFVNNLAPDGAGVKCMSYLWYIPNDYQFYALTPIILIILYKFPAAGIALITGLLAGSLSILAFLASNVYISRKKVIIDVLLDMWDDVYIKPYCRAAPWLVGILLGYIFFKVKKIRVQYYMVAAGWILTILIFVAVFVGGFTNHAKDGRRMEVYEYALFFSLTKLAWPVAISWIIFACHYGYGGFVNSFLSRKSYVPLTRLTYCAYLTHPVIMLTYNFLQQGLLHATEATLIYLAMGNILTALLLTYPYILFFELPFVALEKLVYSPQKSS